MRFVAVLIALCVWSGAAFAQQTSANTIWAGPTSGGAGFPSFRSLVLGDLPQLNAVSFYANPTGSSAVPVQVTLDPSLNWSGTTLKCTSMSASQVGCGEPDNTTIQIVGGKMTVVSLPLSSGGTNNNLTPSLGGIVYSDTSKLDILAGTVTAGLCLLSGSSAAPTWGSCAGSSAVASVTNSDGSLTISPTTGSVVASINTGHSLTWTPTQSFSGNVNAGTAYVGGTGTPNLLLSVGNVFGADASGHPWCDLLAMGAGLTSDDNTVWSNAASTCSGGTIFLPCHTYKNTAHWTIPNGTTVRGAGEACAIINSTSTSDDVFQCASGGQINVSDLTINGTGGNTSVPTSGYAINCGVANSNNDHFERLEIEGTFNGLNVAGANAVITGNRFEELYGTVVINNAAGGQINNNQIDTNSIFNTLSGTGSFATYPSIGSQSIALNTTVTCNGYYFVARVGGTSAPGSTSCNAAGLVATVLMGVDVTDGSVKWQNIGNATLTIINAGAQANIANNDITSPARFGVLINGGGGVNVHDNDSIAGMVRSAVVIEGTAQINWVSRNYFAYIARVGNSGSAGFIPVEDLDGANNSAVIVDHNIFQALLDGAVDTSSDLWNISGNIIFGHNTQTTAICAIQLSGPRQGSTVEANIVSNNASPAICQDAASSANRTTIVGNTVFGQTITTGGTNVVNASNN